MEPKVSQVLWSQEHQEFLEKSQFLSWGGGWGKVSGSRWPVHSFGKSFGIYEADGKERPRGTNYFRDKVKNEQKIQNSEGTRYVPGDASPCVRQDYNEWVKDLMLKRG